MAALGMMAEAANARMLQERVEIVREQLTRLQDQENRLDAVAATLAELPAKLSHQVMVPLGKRAMAPGKIVRSNEVLAHLGDEYFAWRSTPQALELLERKKKALQKQIETQEETLRGLNAKKTDVGGVAQLQKMYEDANIREIQETEAESERGPIPRATDADIKEYFEVEEEERVKQEQAAWNWDDMMKRMEDLEAREAAGENVEEEDRAKKEEEEDSAEAQAAALKAKGNDAFARRRFQAAAQYYSQAIELDPTSHILYGNRAAAYHRLKKYKLALEDSDVAVSLHEPWVKGHYRRACALAALEQFEEAGEAYERAMELSPTDEKLGEKAKQMREKAKAKASGSEIAAQELESKPRQAPVPSTAGPVASPSLKPPVPASLSSSVAPASSAPTAFSGSIVEHEIAEKEPTPVSAPVDSPFSEPRPSRFQGTNYTGQTVTLEPVGEAQPVKRVSRFKAARATRGEN
ncbi:uri1, prefoldin-like chaperone [Phytophthora pseudosyringae]|uniref:Uri1, prefoldin-like chaperone n=1 Tax=Phytophthora pseudosyringae TaxID=221518 RepID=A0A8T1VRY6_9STRA|nr:uri1, prefoldin-like chaperone [Phytophthora pseudosyringae]